MVEQVVVGGGLAGLASAWHLARRGCEVVVLEAREPGHDGASSHGRARMTRSTYGSPLYVDLVREALDRDWPELEAQSGESLIRPVPAVFFGPPTGLFGAFRRATLDAGVTDLEELSPGSARERFPALGIGRTDGVLLDGTGGVISADRTIRVLRERVREAGVEVRTEAPVTGVSRGSRLSLTVGGEHPGELEAQRILVCAGACTARVLPEVSCIVPRRQVVGYAAPGDPDAPSVNWARLDEGLVYGLPAHAGDGAKMAGHRLTGPADDPTVRMPVTHEETLALRRTLGPALRSVPTLARVETCLYAVTKSEDPVLTQLDDPRISVLAGLSGHGFKLGPLLGRIASRVALGEGSGVAAFDVNRARFGLRR